MILLRFITIAGVVYLAGLFVAARNPTKVKNRLRRFLDPEFYLSKFESPQMQELLQQAGWNVQSRMINLFRFLGAILFLAISYGSDWLREETLTVWPLLVTVLALILTGPYRVSLFGWILRKIHYHRLITRDAEVISFLRLYEKSQSKKRGRVQFWAFCEMMAPQFRLLGRDLLNLSRKVNEVGLNEALNWFAQQFYPNHPFIDEVRTIILTAEDIQDPEKVAQYLKDHNKAISRISSDVYAARWDFIGGLANIFNALPSMVTLFMVVMLTLMYVMIIKDKLAF